MQSVMTPKPVILKPIVFAAPGLGGIATQGGWLGKGALNPRPPLYKVPPVGNRPDLRSVRLNLLQGPVPVGKIVDDVEELMKAAVSLGSQGSVARRKGNEAEAEVHFRDAMRFALRAKKQAGHGSLPDSQIQIIFAAASFALDCGEVAEGRRLIQEASSAPHFAGFTDDWVQLCDISKWKDTWLLAAIRQSDPDAAALNVLGDRYWKPLFGRCQLLTSNHAKANDLAQETWCRVLRTRTRLKPGGNFPAYLAAIATNLWRDFYRVSRRSGGLAENRLESLDAPFTHDDGGQSEPLIDRIPDPKNLSPNERSLLILDIDKGLESLTPRLRDVLLARFIQGESCAEIAGRYGCTEQTVSGWIRRALLKMKRHLGRTRPPEWFNNPK